MKEFSKINIYDVTRPEVRRMSVEVAPYCAHTPGHYLTFNLELKLSLMKMRFS